MKGFGLIVTDSRGFGLSGSRSLLAGLLLVIAAGAGAVEATEGKPSTPEERAKALAYIETIEEHPISEEAKEGIAWVLSWLMQTSDITVMACPDILGNEREREGIAPQIQVHHALAAAAYLIENPEASHRSHEVLLAGVEGTLRSYESLKRAVPEAEHAHMEKLLAMRADGTLAKFVKKRLRRCR